MRRLARILLQRRVWQRAYARKRRVRAIAVLYAQRREAERRGYLWDARSPEYRALVDQAQAVRG